MFLTEDEYYFENKGEPMDEDFNLANDHELETESNDYQQGY